MRCGWPTSTRSGLSTEVEVGLPDGIRIPAVTNLDKVQLVARSRLVRRFGRARAETLEALCDALAIAVGCDRRPNRRAP